MNPQRYVKKPQEEATETDLAILRAEAKRLNINSFGLTKQALERSIDAVNAALAKSGTAPAGPGAEAGPEDGPRTDDSGEALGPAAPERIPLGTRQRRLYAEQRPGFYRRYINDVPGRIERAKRAGYAHVLDSERKPVSTPAGTQEHGGGMRAYLMEMPENLRKQDETAKRQANKAIDDALNRGRVGHQSEDRRYIPEQGISIRQG